MSTVSTLAPDAAIVVGIASTAMPFARTPEDEVERWLRVLRLHGQAGVALRALGVGERHADLPVGQAHASGSQDPRTGEQQQDPVRRVTDRALQIARRRGVAGVATADLLLALMEVYGIHFDRVLQAYGTDRRELTQRLGVEPTGVAEGETEG